MNANMKERTRMERTRMVKAMEYICRNVNNENVFDGWLMNGVADGDIEYGDFAPVDDNVDFYIEDESFADLMACFLRIMKRAEESGGLYCGGIVSK